MKNNFILFIFFMINVSVSFSMENNSSDDDASYDDFSAYDSCINYINKTWEKHGGGFVNGLITGSAVGTIVWKGLSLKDHYLGVLLEGGPEFEAMSATGFLLPVSLTALTVGIIAAKFKISLKQAYNHLHERCR